MFLKTKSLPAMTDLSDMTGRLYCSYLLIHCTIPWHSSLRSRSYTSRTIGAETECASIALV